MKTTLTQNTQNAQHTPGPWSACSGDAGQKFNIECAGTGNDLLPVAILKGPDRRANARLIAAAPDLLAALEEITALAYKLSMEAPTLTPSVDRIIPHARAVIARAKGGAS